MALTGVQGTNSPHIIIQEGSSLNGFATVNTTWVFGSVVVVYAGCNKYAVGDNVFYDKSQARRFKLSTINYEAIDEQYIFFTETPALP